MKTIICDIFPIILSIVSIIVSIRAHSKSLETEQLYKASGLGIILGEECDCRDGSIILKLRIKPTAMGTFRHVFVFLVEDEDKRYVKKTWFKKVENLELLRTSIELNTYKYINSIIEEKEVEIKSAGNGMSKVTGIVMIYTDEVGKEWVKDTDNKIYPIKNVMEKLIKIGLPLPGYKSN